LTAEKNSLKQTSSSSKLVEQQQQAHNSTFSLVHPKKEIRSKLDCVCSSYDREKKQLQHPPPPHHINKADFNFAYKCSLQASSQEKYFHERHRHHHLHY